MTSLRDGAPCRVETTGGTVTADQVIVATHFPVPDRGLFFARVHAERSYCIAAPFAGEPSPGMYISASSPTRSIRFHPVEGRELLILGGEGHKVGQGHPTEPRYAVLEDFAREHFGVREIALPLVDPGQLLRRRRSARGQAHASLPAELHGHGLSQVGPRNGGRGGPDARRRRRRTREPLAAPFDSNRLTPLASAADLAKENANVGFHFFADRVTRRSADDASDLAPGEGKVVSRHGRQIAVARDDDGVLHAVSARCTHLGCIVAWNDAERSWDCPCHASRFAPDGSVLGAPRRRDPPDLAPARAGEAARSRRRSQRHSGRAPPTPLPGHTSIRALSRAAPRHGPDNERSRRDDIRPDPQDADAVICLSWRSSPRNAEKLRA